MRPSCACSWTRESRSWSWRCCGTGLAAAPRTGAAPRLYAVIAGLLGIALAVGVSRLRNEWLVLISATAGLFAIGVLPVAPFGVDHVTTLGNGVSDAIKTSHLLRPPT